MAILELKDVTKKFGGLTAVDGVNLKVEENQICALIGPNGAGKTTVFNMITGAYQVTSGDVVFNSESSAGRNHTRSWKRHCPYFPEHPPVQIRHCAGKRYDQASLQDQDRHVQRHLQLPQMHAGRSRVPQKRHWRSCGS